MYIQNLKSDEPFSLKTLALETVINTLAKGLILHPILPIHLMDQIIRKFSARGTFCPKVMEMMLTVRT